MTETAPQFLTVPEAARELQMSVRHLERCIAATQPGPGAIRPFPGWKKVGGKKMTTLDNLRAWFNDAPDA